LAGGDTGFIRSSKTKAEPWWPCLASANLEKRSLETHGFMLSHEVYQEGRSFNLDPRDHFIGGQIPVVHSGLTGVDGSPTFQEIIK